MKLWEVIRDIKPGQVYRSGCGSRHKELSVGENDYLYFRVYRNGELIDEIELAGKFNGNVMRDSEWELVRPPVSFMEAKDSDKEIAPAGGDYDYRSFGEWLALFNLHMSTEKARELMDGKWLIKED